MNCNIILTGGGSGGHLLPARTIALSLKKSDYWVHYVGRDNSLERRILGDAVDTFNTIPTGKLRRYLTPKAVLLNLIDILKVFTGIFTAITVIRKIRKSSSTAAVKKNTMSSHKQNFVMLSTGGYVSLPVVIAGWLLGLPIAIHEQTAAGGLANRIAAHFSKRVFISLPSSNKFYPIKKVVLTGYPIRTELNLSAKSIISAKKSSKEQKNIPNQLEKIFNKKQPVLLFSGGSNGSLLINNIVKKHLHTLSKKYSIIHQTGKDFIKKFKPQQSENYYPFDFISGPEWDAIFIRADVLVGRSGAGIVHECVHLNKRAIFIPLAIAQQNEQLHNAKYAQALIPTIILNETQIKKLTDNEILAHLDSLLKHKNKSTKIKPIKESAISITATQNIITKLIELGA